MSKAMGVRPSTLYGIREAHGDYAEYCFDVAVVSWGQALERDIQDSVSQSKLKNKDGIPAQVLRRWVPATAQYADPAQRRM
jgi:hypothetical protein